MARNSSEETMSLTPETPPDVPAAFSDRSGALIAFGVFELAMGGCCGLLLPFSLLSVMVGPSLPHAAGPQPQARAMLLASLFYALGAAFFITLGIGSIRPPPWARPLILLVSCLCLP